MYHYVGTDYRTNTQYLQMLVVHLVLCIVKERAKQNKKTQGSKAANKKADNKRKSGAMNAKSNKTKNQNQMKKD
mgnify:CR=1 FL=1